MIAASAISEPRLSAPRALTSRLMRLARAGVSGAVSCPDAIGTLLGLDGMPKIDVSRLLAETRGLPMLVREYVEALRTAQAEADAGDTGTGEPGPWWPPASVRELLRTRLQAVSEAARQMLTAAAVLGSDNDADLLRAVSGRGEDEIVEAIDEALVRSLLTEIPPPSPQQAPSYGFESRSAFPVARSTGNDPCSCTINHFPLIFLRQSVRRNVISALLPSFAAPVMRTM